MILGVEDWARDEDLLNRGHRDVMRLATSMVARLVRRLHVLEDGQKHVETLGTRGDLPSRQMLSFCWFCVKLAQPLPTRQMLGKF